jgi:hypothetical protein
MTPNPWGVRPEVRAVVKRRPTGSGPEEAKGYCQSANSRKTAEHALL